MALNIENTAVEKLAEEVATFIGESKTRWHGDARAPSEPVRLKRVMRNRG
jgi:hypothetical protein